MSAHIAMRLAGLGLRIIASNRVKLRALALPLCGLALGGCSIAASQDAALQAANPKAPVPAATYRPVTSGYQRQQPVEPLPWRERNDRVAPQEKPGERP